MCFVALAKKVMKHIFYMYIHDSKIKRVAMAYQPRQ
jgi:hypothetical protein